MGPADHLFPALLREMLRDEFKSHLKVWAWMGAEKAVAFMKGEIINDRFLG